MTTLYGVRQETLAAYVAAERKKVWEAAAKQIGQYKLAYTSGDVAVLFADYCLQQAAKETSNAIVD